MLLLRWWRSFQRSLALSSFNLIDLRCISMWSKLCDSMDLPTERSKEKKRHQNSWLQYTLWRTQILAKVVVAKHVTFLHGLRNLAFKFCTMVLRVFYFQFGNLHWWEEYISHKSSFVIPPARQPNQSCKTIRQGIFPILVNYLKIIILQIMTKAIFQ